MQGKRTRSVRRGLLAALLGIVGIGAVPAAALANPSITVTGTPTGKVANDGYAPMFTSDDPQATFFCQRDNSGAFEPCVTNAARRSHEGDNALSVYALSGDGLTQSQTLTFTWVLDTEIPTVILGYKPGPGTTVNRTYDATDFTVSEVPSTTFCSVDYSPWAACTSPLKLRDLPDGAHSVRVRASDGLRYGPVESKYWTVDTTPPETSIAGGPAEGSVVPDTIAKFAFVSSEPGSWYECALDGAQFDYCGFTLALELAAGRHSLNVRANDGHGNIDRTPAYRTWTVAPPPDQGSEKPTVPQKLAFKLAATAKAKRTSTTLSALAVKGAPAGATVKVACKGTCPKKTQTLKTGADGSVVLTAFQKKALKVGTTLTVTVTRTGMTGRSSVLKVRAGKRPSVTSKALA
jgi:large repetitive protein